MVNVSLRKYMTYSLIFSLYDILVENAEVYFNRFMENKELLTKYAIEKGMAEKSISKGKRFRVYQEFKEEAHYEDIDWDEGSDEF